MEASQWIHGESLSALGTSLRDSLSSTYTYIHIHTHEDEYDYDCENHSQIRAIIGDGIIENDSEDLIISDDHDTTSDYEGNRTIM